MAERDVTRREFVRDSAAVAAVVAVGGLTASGAPADTSKIRNYNKDMEYRPLGDTGLMISAVCLGGHWKRIDTQVPGVLKSRSWLSAKLDMPGFKKNRRDVVTRCIERGFNYIDACTWQEIMAYSEALRGRREQMHLGFSWYQEEMRNARFRTCKALLGTLDKGMQKAKLEYVDLWRITMHERSSKHPKAEVDEMMKALEQAKKQGKARFVGFSSHDRPHIKLLIETYPNVVDVVVTPYTAKSKVAPKDSVFEAIGQHKVGMFGIKPFASGSLFKARKGGKPTQEELDRRARMAIRYVLCNPALTAPIPGLINPQQVDNVADAVKERRQLDEAEARELRELMDHAWTCLPPHYEWLKDWEYV